MECGPKVKEKINLISRQVIKSRRNHKFCIHTRRGDFIDAWMLESEREFIRAGVKHIFETSRTKQSSTGIIFGEDVEFIKSLDLNHYVSEFIELSLQ